MLPAEAVPDGFAWAPHHLTWGLLITLLIVFIVWDDYRRKEPVITTGAVGLALFSFLFIWPFYPVLGALGTLAGVSAALAVALAPGEWDVYPTRYRILAASAALIALDDAVSHAFGVWTPVDALWKVMLGG